jgi:uncharacterized protein
MADLVWSDAITADAHAIRGEVEQHLACLGVPGRVELTGAASLPGVLTKGDIDLHLRVTEPGAFPGVVELLGDHFQPASPEAWAGTLAVFEVPGGRPTGLAVTPVDSEHDRRFRRCWIRLREEPLLLSEYNAMKRTSYGGPSYEALKTDFFNRIAQE